MSTTTDLSNFGTKELRELEIILEAWRNYGLPEDFEANEVIPMLNKISGDVFLINSEYQHARVEGNKLETWYTCSHCGHEGFKEDCQLIENPPCFGDTDRCNECYIEDEPENQGK